MLVRVGVLATAALLLVGCRTQVVVDVHADAAGKGELAVEATLDRAAAQGIGDPATALSVDDLRAAGWTVDPIRTTRTGGAVLRVHHPFGAAREADALLRGLTAADGPLSDLHLTRHAGPFGTTLRLHGTADLTRGLDAFGDAGLAAVLATGSPLAVEPSELARQAGGPLTKAFRLSVRASLAASAPVTVELPLGRRVGVDVSTLEWDPFALVGTAALAVGLVLGAVLLVRARRAAIDAHRAGEDGDAFEPDDERDAG